MAKHVYTGELADEKEMVDKSPTFPEMLKKLEVWLDKHDLRDEDNRLRNALWVTDGVSYVLDIKLTF